MNLTSKQIKRLKQTLLLQKQELEKRMDDEHGLTDSLSEMTAELSTYDNHPADVATELFERSKDLSLNESREFELQDIDDALARIEQKSYGKCVVCGDDIPYKRMEALPSTPYCIQHSPSHSSRNRPVEEEMLERPFGRNSFDESDKETEFDAEDAWQIVEQWGTSTSPAYAESNEVEDYDQLYIESDENSGYVENIESFLATDITGEHRFIVRNKKYHEYMQNEEGDHKLEVYNLPSDEEQ